MIAPKPASDSLPISRRSALFPILALFALIGLMFGPIGRQFSDDMPESKTHPYFPDHVWPYPILAVAVLVGLGLLALTGQQVVELGPPADPRAAINPIPEWYFMPLFQFAKLGPAVLTKMLIPGAMVIGLLLWPLLDTAFGSRIAQRLKWHEWPAPKRNVITSTIWFGALAVIAALTLWSALAPQLCIPWPFNGPVCGA